MFEKLKALLGAPSRLDQAEKRIIATRHELITASHELAYALNAIDGLKKSHVVALGDVNYTIERQRRELIMLKGELVKLKRKTDRSAQTRNASRGRS